MLTDEPFAQTRELADAQATIEQLRAQIAELQKRCETQNTDRAPAVQYSTAQELELYRRAERTERVAKERAEQVYRKVNSALSDATDKVDEAFDQLGDLTNRVSGQLTQLQDAVKESRQALADASSSLCTIRPGKDGI